MKTTFCRFCMGAAVIAGFAGLFACANKPDVAGDAGHPSIGAPDASAHSGAADDHAQTSAATPAEVASASPMTPGVTETTPKAKPWGDATIATVNGIAIPTAELVQPLIEAHGLGILVAIVQRDLAKQACDQAIPPIVVTSDDFKTERERTLSLLFQELDAKVQEDIDKAEKAREPDQNGRSRAQNVEQLREEHETQRQQLLKQFYEQKHLTPTEFDIVVQTNTYLRKFAEPKVAGKVTEEMLHKEFSARYGEKVRVRHIQLARPQDYIVVKERLAKGEKFEDVARAMSENHQTGPLGGELPPFNQQETRLPAVFVQVAFDLKVGQVSDLVNADDTYHLIKLEERIPPHAVVFEQQREILTHDLHEQMLQTVINKLREVIALNAQKTLKISDPVMRQQFDARVKELDETVKGRQAAEAEMAKEHDKRRLMWQAEMQAASRPATTQAAPTAPVTALPPPPATVPTAPAAPATAPVTPPTAPATAPVVPPTAPAAPSTAPAAPPTVPAAPAKAPATAPAAAPPATRPG